MDLGHPNQQLVAAAVSPELKLSDILSLTDLMMFLPAGSALFQLIAAGVPVLTPAECGALANALDFSAAANRQHRDFLEQAHHWLVARAESTDQIRVRRQPDAVIRIR